MAKTSGLGSHLYVGQYDISGDVGAVNNIETMQAQQDVSSIEDLATARLGLRRDGSMSLVAFWNATAASSMDDTSCCTCDVSMPFTAPTSPEMSYCATYRWDRSPDCFAISQAPWSDQR